MGGIERGCSVCDCQNIVEEGASMEMAYRERWAAEIAAMRRVLAGFEMKEERKWGKPTYTVDGKNVVIIQGFKEYFALGFFQGALLKDPEKVLVQLGQVQAGRVMKFISAKEIVAKAATIKAYVREAIAVQKAGLRMERKKTSDFPVPEELTQQFRMDPRFKRAFEALTPGRQRSYLYHFAAARQSATRVARIEKAMPAIFEGMGFLERSGTRR
ncbi:MAG TPA: YdeI/OmpD-associated family protein [Gemmatimonadales bacterium]